MRRNTLPVGVIDWLRQIATWRMHWEAGISVAQFSTFRFRSSGRNSVSQNWAFILQLVCGCFVFTNEKTVRYLRQLRFKVHPSFEEIIKNRTGQGRMKSVNTLHDSKLLAIGVVILERFLTHRSVRVQNAFCHVPSSHVISKNLSPETVIQVHDKRMNTFFALLYCKTLLLKIFRAKNYSTATAVNWMMNEGRTEWWISSQIA